jgi:hypothetical protein
VAELGHRLVGQGPQTREVARVDLLDQAAPVLGLDEPLGLGKISGAQMSKPTTSAPSRAIWTACSLPWPRAAPEMTTTLPSSRPMTAPRQ